MGQNLVQKILGEHLVSGQVRPGEEIGIRVDQTLVQDATGTMAFLQFESMRIPRIRTRLSVTYVDHNMLQTGFENADDHRYLQSVSAKFGAYFSRPGNGICHQVHLERFAAPGQTLLGSDSHTPTAGGVGTLAIGAGGLDVAVAMGGGPYYVTMPKVLGVVLTGRLQPWVTGKDVILWALKTLTVKGGVGRIIEYTGPGVQALTVTERATITNMGAELGATTSIFPSDEQTQRYLVAQGRGDVWRPLAADPDAGYDEIIELNLDTLEPLIACPSLPDRVVPVREVAGTPVDQVCVGSCTNSSYADLMRVATIVQGRQVHPRVSLTVTPGSKQVYEMVARAGGLAEMIAAGARILESSCGPCIGMGQAPATGTVSVRSFNRNFMGRSGTKQDAVYLTSPEVCAVTALTGAITDPRDWGPPVDVTLPERFLINDNLLISPPADGSQVEIVRGPNIKEVPTQRPLPASLAGTVLIKVGDDITTDHIMPAGAKILPLRSNIPAMAEYVFRDVDPAFPERARAMSGGFIVGGENYGQGSSREHAALVPMYLGIQGVLVRSFARIHLANLINFGILPLTFSHPADYDRIAVGDRLVLEEVPGRLDQGAPLVVRNETKAFLFEVTYRLSTREREIMKAGGLVNYTRLTGTA